MWECRTCHERHQDSFEVCWNCGTSKDGEADPHFVKADEQITVPGPEVPEPDDHAITADAPTKRRRRPRTIEQLIFVGLNGYALALDRDTGKIVWSNSEMRSGYVSLFLDGDRLIVSTNGYMYCLNPLNGRILWHNPLTGYGMGPTSMTSVRGGQITQAQSNCH